jgi:hypothetical protein
MPGSGLRSPLPQERRVVDASPGAADLLSGEAAMEGVGARVIALSKRLRVAARDDEKGVNEACLLVHLMLMRILRRDPELEDATLELDLAVEGFATGQPSDQKQEAEAFFGS